IPILIMIEVRDDCLHVEHAKAVSDPVLPYAVFAVFRLGIGEGIRLLHPLAFYPNLLPNPRLLFQPGASGCCILLPKLTQLWQPLGRGKGTSWKFMATMR